MTELDKDGLEAAVSAVADSEGWNGDDMHITKRTAKSAITAYLAALSSKGDVEGARVFVLSDDHYDLLEKLTPNSGDECKISKHDRVLNELVSWGLAYIYEDGDYNTHAAISLRGLKTLRSASSETARDPLSVTAENIGGSECMHCGSTEGSCDTPDEAINCPLFFTTPKPTEAELVQRYRWELIPGSGTPLPIKRAEGEWVKYSDHASTLQAFYYLNLYDLKRGDPQAWDISNDKKVHEAECRAETAEARLKALEEKVGKFIRIGHNPYCPSHFDGHGTGKPCECGYDELRTTLKERG